MATLPLILSLTDELDALSSRFDNDLGLGYYHRRPRQHVHHPSISLVAPAFNLVRNAKSAIKDGAAPVVGKDGFQVCMDVQLFNPNELTVKVIDNSIVVEGKHEEREDEHGGIYRHFIRRYVLPEGYDQNEVVSTLSSDGVLTVKVPPPQKTDTKERIIHIQHTGPAHLSVKDNKNDKNEEDKPKEEEK